MIHSSTFSYTLVYVFGCLGLLSLLLAIFLIIDPEKFIKFHDNKFILILFFQS